VRLSHAVDEKLVLHRGRCRQRWMLELRYQKQTLRKKSATSPLRKVEVWKSG